MKDWKDSTAYQNAGEKSMRRWAWEFLRRNPKYREDQIRIAELVSQYGDPSDWDDHAETAAFSLLFECSPPALEGESESQWKRRVLVAPGDKANLKSVYRAVCRKYHLRGSLPDPAMDWSEAFEINFWLEGGGMTYHYRNLASTNMRIEPPNALEEALVRFDLTKPIPPQIKAAKQQLNFWQVQALGKKVSWRHWRQNFSLYLQILDALEAGATYRTIAATLFPDEKNPYPDYPVTDRIKKSAAKAKELRDGGYVTFAG